MTGEPVHIETIQPPVDYAFEQIAKACAIAQYLNRGKLVLAEPPADPQNPSA